MAGIVEEESCHRTADGIDLYTKSWYPNPTVPSNRALLVYTHGIESHTGWFAESGREMAERGHPAVSADRRGCGKSAGPRGHMASYRQILDDLASLVQSQKSRWGENRPAVGVGLSLGGLFMTALAMRQPGLLDGVIGLVPAVASSLGFSRIEVLEMLFASAFKPRRLYPIPIRVEMFTGDAEALAFIRRDGLRLTHASARFFWSLLRMRGWVNANAEKMTVPLLTLLAEDDEIIDNRRVRKWLEKVGSPIGQTVEYPGVKHSILFEPCRERVLEDIERFLLRVESS